MCIANPIYHPCSHTSVMWLHCPSKEASQDEACMNVNFLRGEDSPEACPLKSCKFPGRDKGWICCHCQGGPNYTGWCTMPSLRSTRAFNAPWSDLGSSTCDHGCCKRCVKVKGEHQLPLSAHDTFQKPSSVHHTECDSSSSNSRVPGWSSSSSGSSRKSRPNSSPPSSTDGSYTGQFGPPDAALRGFYDKYVSHGSAMDVPDKPDWDMLPEPIANGHWGEVPAEQIPVQSVTVQKKRKDKGKSSDGRSKKSTSSKSHKRKR